MLLGLAMEFLAHVVYGRKGLAERTTMKDICENFYEDCPGTLCHPNNKL